MLFAHNLSQNGTEEQRQRYLPDALQGKYSSIRSRREAADKEGNEVEKEKEMEFTSLVFITVCSMFSDVPVCNREFHWRHGDE
mgnify:CR=1 FL=1